MATILIPTIVRDTEALLVCAGIQAKGHRAIRWFMRDYPARQRTSFRASSNSAGLSIDDESMHVERLEFDTLWYRRPRRPYLGDYASIPAEDREFVEGELVACRTGIWEWLSIRGQWVNSLHGAKRANSKICQLGIATEVGLAIPDTLISNDPVEIRDFVRSRQAIYKTLMPAVWETPTGSLLCYTSAVREDDLPDNDLLQAVPGIYQTLIKKKFDVRAVLFGGLAFTVRINSQDRSETAVDWRGGNSFNLVGGAIELPAEVLEKCRKLMARLGIVFGAFDFAVDEDGRYIFLEVNQAGQSMWLEELAPELHILDALTDFLIDPTSTPSVGRGRPIMDVQSLSAMVDLEEILKKDLATHSLADVRFIDPSLRRNEAAVG